MRNPHRRTLTIAALDVIVCSTPDAGTCFACGERIHVSTRQLGSTRVDFLANVSAPVVANRADEKALDIGYPQALRVAVSVDSNRVPAFRITAEDMQPVSSRTPHLAKGNILVRHHATDADQNRAAF
jgi:hypothetical protein